MRELKFSQLVDNLMQGCFSENLEKILSHLKVHFSPGMKNTAPSPLLKPLHESSTPQRAVLCLCSPSRGSGLRGCTAAGCASGRRVSSLNTQGFLENIVCTSRRPLANITSN